MILTKDQGRSEGDKKRMWIRKNRYIESDKTHCCTRKFNIALSLCKVLGLLWQPLDTMSNDLTNK